MYFTLQIRVNPAVNSVSNKIYIKAEEADSNCGNVFPYTQSSENAELYNLK